MIKIKNIIFDLGGVLLNIDYTKTSSAFRNLGVENFDEKFSQFYSDELFEKLETGKISETNFYSKIKACIAHPVYDTEIEIAWNAMILSFRTESLRFLESMAPNYRLFLLSNTNSIHLRFFQQVFIRDTGKPSLDDYFSKCWYSHLLGLRKPGKEIYEFVLMDADIRADETLFIDDSINNIEAAAAIGIITHHLKEGENVEGLKY